MTTLRLLQWNQGDDGVPLPDGYDVATLQERNDARPSARFERHTARRLKGLAIDYDPDQWTDLEVGSKVAHVGLAKVTPARGTLWITGKYEGCRLTVMCSHPINDPAGEKRAFGPIRRLVWTVCAWQDRRLAQRFITRGDAVLLGSDINDREAGVKRLRRLLRGHLDAICYHPGSLRLVGQVRSIGRRGSDHAGYIATFEFKEHR